jgi:hypothetical protein
VNTQDVAADKWVAPKLAVKQLSQPSKPSLDRSTLLRQALTPKKLAAPKLTRCSEGLVNVSGRCLPKLKK